jgi:hypothetical protein
MDNPYQHVESSGESSHSSHQISIWLDEYDDIFSDFDPRPYSERILSDDFISELKKVSREEKFAISELRLLIPGKIRKQEFEPIIIKRIHTHFRNGNSYLINRMKITRAKAVLITVAGLILILLASYVSALQSDKFYMKVIIVLFEPAGWFFVWTGMDDLFFAGRKRKDELDFFSKMAKTKIVFASF